MKLLLDTHVFLWAAAGDERLPANVQALLSADEHQILVSAASLWEIVIKASAGLQFRWLNTKSVSELETWVHRMGAEVLPIAASHAVGTWYFREWTHKDPFDRMIVTQAITERAMLVTADKALQSRPGLRWVWDNA